MLAIYKTASPQDMQRIITHCRKHSVKNGGPFEVYPGPEDDTHMVIVNPCPDGGSPDTSQPLGAFYCNYNGPGVISIEEIEEEDPHSADAKTRQQRLEALKQVIDQLLTGEEP